MEVEKGLSVQLQIERMISEGSPVQAVVEDGSNPPTHPLRIGGWLRCVTDPVLRGAEELAIATGREEKLG